MQTPQPRPLFSTDVVAAPEPGAAGIRVVNRQTMRQECRESIGAMMQRVGAGGIGGGRFRHRWGKQKRRMRAHLAGKVAG